MYKIHTLFRSGIVVLLFTAVVCHAQIFNSVRGNAKAFDPGQTFPVQLTTSAFRPQPPFVASANELALSYENNLISTFDFPVPLNAQPYLLGSVGERMTLPTKYAYLDSVSIRIDSLQSDSIGIDVLPDTLYTINGERQFHLINIFSPSAVSFDSGVIHLDPIHSVRNVVIPMHHTKVPNNFYVTVSPTDTLNGGIVVFLNNFRLVGDSGTSHTRTAENSRSAYIAIGNGQVISGVLDSTFYLNSDPNYLVFTNFYITAYVDTTGFTGVNESTQPPHDIAISNFPNPFNSSTQINIANTQTHTSLKIYDALDREVSDLTQQIAASSSSQVVFNAGNLPAGIYYAKLQTGSSVVTRSLMVLK
ncbi:MAG TPA: T9SS type A sorting domain-containing protein [Candidatus Kapabacteria bacterium]|nr:T9SS type A sorting domain-containing protein [Candidatus Kapabacteria bacterium]